MKTRIGTTTLAVLELKRQRAQRLLQELDELHDQVVALLDIAPHDNARGLGRFSAGNYVDDFLNGDQEPRHLCELLGIEVGP